MDEFVFFKLSVAACPHSGGARTGVLRSAGLLGFFGVNRVLVRRRHVVWV